MPTVNQSIEIHCPPETAFELVAHQPERMSEWWKAMELQQRVTPAPTALGSISRYVYNMVGIRLKGEHRVLIYQENRRLLVKTISGIDASFDFSFESLAENRTRMSVQVEYKFSTGILGQLIDRAMLESKNRHDLEVSLKNIKSILEHTPAEI